MLHIRGVTGQKVRSRPARQLANRIWYRPQKVLIRLRKVRYSARATLSNVAASCKERPELYEAGVEGIADLWF